MSSAKTAARAADQMARHQQACAARNAWAGTMKDSSVAASDADIPFIVATATEGHASPAYKRPP